MCDGNHRIDHVRPIGILILIRFTYFNAHAQNIELFVLQSRGVSYIRIAMFKPLPLAYYYH